MLVVQAWRVPHPPARGHRLWGTQPLVHVGFMKSWQAGGFNHKVIKRVMELVHSRKTASGKLKIYITGDLHFHSPCKIFLIVSTRGGIMSAYFFVIG